MILGRAPLPSRRRRHGRATCGTRGQPRVRELNGATGTIGSPEAREVRSTTRYGGTGVERHADRDVARS